MARGNRFILGCGAAAILLLLQHTDAKAFPGEDDGTSNRLKRSTSSTDNDDAVVTDAAGNGEGGAGPVPVAGSGFGTSATFKLPLAAGLDSSVATQVVGPSNAVVIEAQGDGSAGAGPVPVAGPNFGSSATFYLPTGTGEAGTVVVGPTDDLAVVVDAAEAGTGSVSPTAVANLGGGVAPRLPNAATFDPKDPMVVYPHNPPTSGGSDDVVIVAKRRVGPGGRTGDSGSSPLTDDNDGFGLGVDEDYDDDENTQSSQNADSETTNQGTVATSTDAGAATTDDGAATTDAGAAMTDAGEATDTEAAPTYVGAAASAFPQIRRSGLIIQQVSRPNVCERTARTGTILIVRATGALWDANGPQFYSWVDNNEALRFQLGVGQVIPGWDQGIAGMCVSEKRRLTVPSSLAYGEQGAGELIPGGATLVFDIELLNIEEGAINPATSNIGSNSGSNSHGSGGGYGGSGYTGNAGGSFSQGFYPTNPNPGFKPSSQSRPTIPGTNIAQNIVDLIPGLGTGATFVNGINNVGSGIGNYLNQLGNNINRPINNGLNHLGINQNQNQLNNANQRPTGLANNNPLNCNNPNFYVDPSLCHNHYIPQTTQQNINNPYDFLNDCRYNRAIPCPGATPIAGPTQGQQPTFKLPTGQGFKPGEPTRIVSPNQIYNGRPGSPVNYLTGGNPFNAIPGWPFGNGFGRRR